jgi:hypothetical protein
VFVARNLFKDPNPPPPPQKMAVPPAPPRPPLPTLVGVIFVGEEGKAILKSRDRQDAYGVGEAVAGGTITKITPDGVVLNFPDRASEILLKSTPKKVIPPGMPMAAAGEPKSFDEQQKSVSAAGEEGTDRATKRTARLRRANQRN